MSSIDLLDISHWNGIADRKLIPDIPIVHKVCEGGKPDKTWADRRQWIAQHNEICGGYIVLWPERKGKITLVDQLEFYAEQIETVWRPGFITQLDIEPWDYLSEDQDPDPDEVVAAYRWYEREFGRPPLVYVNPRQLPGHLPYIRREIPDALLWEPHYGKSGEASAIKNGAVLHQWTSKAPVPGFTGGVDANTILRHDELRRAAGLNQPAPTPGGPPSKPKPQPAPQPSPTPTPPKEDDDMTEFLTFHDTEHDPTPEQIKPGVHPVFATAGDTAVVWVSPEQYRLHGHPKPRAVGRGAARARVLVGEIDGGNPQFADVAAMFDRVIQ